MKTKVMSALEKRIRREAVIKLTCEPEDVAVRGNCMASGDDAVDRAQEDMIISQLDNGNEWAWCVAVVKAKWNGLHGTDTLGCCSYRDEAEFKQPGGYYSDMVEEVIGQIVNQAERIRKA